MNKSALVACLSFLALQSTISTSARAEDWTMWGRTPTRQMLSPEKNPPTEWDVDAAKNIKWTADLGSKSYGNPVIVNGLVIVGTNNAAPRNPAITADAGVLMIFDEQTGKFLYQRASLKLPAGRVNDWPQEGLCSTACAEGNFIWFCTNRCEVVCLDISPLKSGQQPKEVWVHDMMAKEGVFPHNMTACSTAIWKDNIYIITGNGVDETHKNLPAPDAPSVICFNKSTGAVVWMDKSPGNRILHGEWASPAIATLNGKTQVICPLGDGWIYSFDAATGKVIWKFDSNNKATIYPTTRNELIATPSVVGNLCYIANGQDPEHGEGPGHLWCIDITKEGDVSMELPLATAGELLAPEGQAKAKPNPNSAVVWHFDKLPVPGAAKAKDRMNRAISTVAVTDGLAFAPDFCGYLHCLDAKTGQHLWTSDTGGAIWGSPMVADGKLYLCNEQGLAMIYPVARELDKSKIITHDLGSASYCSPVLANGVLYLTTRDKLFSIK